MTSKEQEIIKEKGKERLKILREYDLRRREWYQDIDINIADKQLEHTISISTISAAIIALTVTLQTQKNFWVDLSFWSLLSTVILGIFLVLLILSYNKKNIKDSKDVELSIISTLQKSTKLVIENPATYEQHQADFDQQIQKIEELPEKYKLQRKILEYLYYLLLVTFFLGFLGLIGGWLTKDIVLVNNIQNTEKISKTLSTFEQTHINNSIIIGMLILVSLVLGFIKFGSIPDTKDWVWERKFAEIWNNVVNFFIPGLIGYYFVLIRWPLISTGESLNIWDFVLFVIFILGLFGHLCVMSKNITDGINAILSRVLERG